jgi:hypothetical protein
MNRYYGDILDKIKEEPLWFDESAVPRYCAFSPNEIADIYAEECVLLLIECQGCRKEFNVVMSFYRMDAVYGEKLLSADVSSLHYGDPPNVDCCAAGPTMNSVPKKVIEFWSRGGESREWCRIKELEIDIKCDWADESVP